MVVGGEKTLGGQTRPARSSVTGHPRTGEDERAASRPPNDNLITVTTLLEGCDFHKQLRSCKLLKVICVFGV